MRGIYISTILAILGLSLIGLIKGDLLTVVTDFEAVRGYVLVTLLVSAGLGIVANAVGHQD